MHHQPIMQGLNIAVIVLRRKRGSESCNFHSARAIVPSKPIDGLQTSLYVVRDSAALSRGLDPVSRPVGLCLHQVAYITEVARVNNTDT